MQASASPYKFSLNRNNEWREETALCGLILMSPWIHFRLADGTILAGPASSPAYSLWTPCSVRGCASRLRMPEGAVQAWCWKCLPRNTCSWRELHLRRLGKTVRREYIRWIAYNTGDHPAGWGEEWKRIHEKYCNSFDPDN